MLPLPATLGALVLEIAIAIPASYFLVSCLEHFIHKRTMHTRGLPRPLYKVLPYLNWILDEHAVQHHGRFYKQFDHEPDPAGKEVNIVIGPHEALSMGAAFLPMVLPVALFLSPVGAAVFYATGAVHNFTWGKIHRQMHVPEQGSWFRDHPVYRFLARHHYLHHEFPTRNFNVVMPAADWVFGTVAKPKPAHVKEMLRLGYLKPRTARGARGVAKQQHAVALSTVPAAPALAA